MRTLPIRTCYQEERAHLQAAEDVHAPHVRGAQVAQPPKQELEDFLREEAHEGLVAEVVEVVQVEVRASAEAQMRLYKACRDGDLKEVDKELLFGDYTEYGDPDESLEVR